MDMLLSTGEQVTISLLAMALQQVGVAATSHTGAQVGIHTTTPAPKRVFSALKPKTLRLTSMQARSWLWLVFRALDEDEITTLGRGGSDTTGVALARRTRRRDARSIPTLMGFTPLTPRVCTKAQRLECITVRRNAGACKPGLQSAANSVEFAGKYNVPRTGTVEL